MPRKTPLRTPAEIPAIKDIELKISNTLCTLLGIEPEELDRNKAFRELGLGFKAREKFLAAIREDFGVQLSALKLFDYPTAKELSYYLFNELSPGTAKEAAPQRGASAPQKLPGRGSAAETSGGNNSFDVAIIGLSCRFSGADSAIEFWQNLKGGISSIGEIDRGRWEDYSWYNPDPNNEGTSYNRWGGFVNDSDKFDPLFFGISPVETLTMDPQQRLFLEECWKAIEDAGYNPESLSRRKVGVFAGADAGDYLHLLQQRGGDKAGAAFTGSSQAILAARISYFLNLTGPAMAIDTACSSSLVAIDRAYQSIVSGESEMVLAGGVYLMNTPTDHIWASRVGMLSKGDQCKTFDDSADGITLGEGVGVVLLKKLEQAEKDGDRIYAVIKGSGINQDGKTNGITAPSARSQKELELGVYENYGIDPSSITYIEAHGTGTKLGDPIEVNALIESFRQYTDQKQYCAIGSVKSNIGHTAFAAGIAGFAKTVLMLANKQYVPSLHFNKANREIDFDDSPFYVNTELKEWKAPEDAPRRAAISSFGFSGTNAHMIVEEYRPKSYTHYHSDAPALVVLSARNAARLREQAANLNKYLQAHPHTNLHDLAYTLQVGREAMEERLAFTADDNDHLASLLSLYLQGGTTNIYTGNIKKERSAPLHDEESGQALKEALEKKEEGSLARLWAAGADIDWNLLYEDQKPQRISLPTYPFARERYWIEKPQGTLPLTGQLHPLVHRNDSDLSEQKYTSIFSGQESFLVHHQVQGRKILPGVAYLELAREAGSLASGEKITQLKDVTWLTPIHVNGSPEKVHIRLSPTEEEVSYEVYTGSGEELVHSRGRLLNTEVAPALKHDLAKIRSGLGSSMESSRYYELFEEMGLQYGSSFRGIEQLYYGEGEALSRISVAPQDGFVLPPGLMDSALQTTVGLQLGKGTPELCLPYSVGEVTIHAELPQSLWCYVRRSAAQEAGSTLNTYDIDLLDDQGHTLVQFKELVALPLERPASRQEKHKEQTAGLLYVPVWERARNNEGTPFQAARKCLLVRGHSRSSFSAELKQLLAEMNCEVIEVEEPQEVPPGITDVYLLQGLAQAGEQTPLSEGYKQRELSVFNTLKLLMASGYAEKKLTITAFTGNTQKVLSTDVVETMGSGIVGLMGSLSKEQVFWNVRMLDLELSHKGSLHLEKILAAPYDPEGAVTAYRNGFRYERSLYPVSLAAGLPCRIRQGGTYVLLGGAGGIGKVTTAFLVREYKAQVIWLGRRAADEKIASSQREIEALGAKPLYIQCDANDRISMEKAYREIKESFPRINGVFHSAIVLQDMLLRHMTAEDFLSAFEPKALGSHHLVETFSAEPLDFICFYSSVQSQWTMAGQANYAAGCTYKDSYAHSLHAAGVPACIVNWGYWGDVGIVSGDAYRQRMASLGVGSITEEEGMDILNRMLSGNNTQTIAIKLIHDN